MYVIYVLYIIYGVRIQICIIHSMHRIDICLLTRAVIVLTHYFFVLYPLCFLLILVYFSTSCACTIVCLHFYDRLSIFRSNFQLLSIPFFFLLLCTLSFIIWSRLLELYNACLSINIYLYYTSIHISIARKKHIWKIKNLTSRLFTLCIIHAK
jgi:hypothetical protein